MSLLIIGLNHTTASIGLRERLAFTADQLGAAVAAAGAVHGVSEAVLLSTCNRTELVVQTEGAPGVDHQLCAWLAGARHLPLAELEGSLYHHHGEAALEHLIRVASGLDSMVMGEPQIFGQLKSAYSTARASGTVGAVLGRTFEHVFTVAKRVRSETAIGQNPVSVAYAAVRLSRHIFDDFSRTTALLIGAGEMVELLARHLVEAGVPRIIIANRTLPRAEQLAAQHGGEAILLAQIPDHLARADIVMSCTAAQLPILGKGTVEQAMRARRRKPVLMVDIAVPRDIEAQVAELEDVYLYSIDDLQQIVDDNRRAREQEAGRAAGIVSAGVEEWRRSQRGRDAVGTLREYRERAASLRDIELERALRQLRAGGNPEQVLAQFGRNLTNKLVHGPSVAMRRAGEEGRQDVLDSARNLFGLDDDEADGDGPGSHP
jgi:glutamyl-tRNA reductase